MFLCSKCPTALSFENLSAGGAEASGQREVREASIVCNLEYKEDGGKGSLPKGGNAKGGRGVGGQGGGGRSGGGGGGGIGGLSGKAENGRDGGGQDEATTGSA